MKQIYYAWKTLLHQRGASAIKVVSVGIGLGMAALLLASVAYTRSFDRHFPDSDRLYQLWMEWGFDGNTTIPSLRCVGKIAGGVLDAMPDVVEYAATARDTRNSVFVGDVMHESNTLYADSLIFKTLGTEVLRGDAVKELAQPDAVFVSDAMARRLFGDDDPVGKRVTINEMDMSVRGVFKAIPATSTIKADVVVSLPTFWSRNILNYSWEGGDSWIEYVRLRNDADVSAEALSRRITEMYHTHAPDCDGLTRRIIARPITETLLENDSTLRIMNVVMTVLAAVLIVITVLNYVLISLASLSRRAKAIGVQKCSGAGRGDIIGIFLYETLMVVIGGAVLMAILVWLLQDFIETTLQNSLSTLLAPERLWIIAAVIGLLAVAGGVVPAYVFSRIPVTHVFRRFTDRRRGWKKTLLAIQFAGVAFICAMLGVVSAQYSHVLNIDLGYNPKNVAVGHHEFETYEAGEAVRDYYRNLPMVEAVASAWGTPVWGYSGQVIPDESGRSRFSSRYDSWDKDYADMMGFTLLRGRYPKDKDETAVNQTFAEHMGWGESDAVGRVFNAGRETMTVTGVIRDFTICDCFANGREEFMMVYQPRVNSCFHLRLKEPFAQNLEALNERINNDYPGGRIEFSSMERMIEMRYSAVRLFRDLALIASVTILFISLMGLIGYVGNEIQRRSKEIAVRKINGADSSAVIDLIAGDVMRVALPSVMAGAAIAGVVGTMTLYKVFDADALVGNLWIWYVVPSIAILGVIALCVCLQSRRIANENPVVSLRSE